MKPVKPKIVAITAEAMRLQRFIGACETAVQSVEHLRQGLPDKDAAIKLNRLFVLLADTLSEEISRSNVPGQGDVPGRTAGRATIDVDVIAAIARITNALMGHVHSNLAVMQPIIGSLSEWPVIASVEPSRDSRRVVKDPDGAAAMRYKPLADHLGKMRFFPGKTSRGRSIFRQIAGDAAQCAYVMNCGDWAWREVGLPGVFEFEDTASKLHRPHIESSKSRPSRDLDGVAKILENLARLGGPRPKETIAVPVNPPDPSTQFDARSSAIALKYYLYLTLAPEPERTQLREVWRTTRVEKFKQLRLEDAMESILHQLLVNPALANEIDPSGKVAENILLHFPALADYCLPSLPPWVKWWGRFLQCEPPDIFGDRVPLTEWSDPAIRTCVDAETVKNRAWSGFGRCVDRVLDAYLHLCGIKEGLKGVTEEGTLPSIFVDRRKPDRRTRSVSKKL